MKELIGQKCSVVFNLPSHEWPIGGYPALVTISAVDMPMVKMLAYSGVPIWVNVATIKTILPMGPPQPQNGGKS